MFFQDDTLTYGGIYAADAPEYSFTLPTIFSLVQSVDCSFAGGCDLYINNFQGLSASVAFEFAQVQVCGVPCEIDLDTSDADNFYCSVPSLSTVYSIDEYDMESDHALYGTLFGNNEEYLPYAFDGDNQAGYEDDADTCFFGMYFDSSKVGIVSEVKIYMNDFIEFTKEHYTYEIHF